MAATGSTRCAWTRAPGGGATSGRSGPAPRPRRTSGRSSSSSIARTPPAASAGRARERRAMNRNALMVLERRYLLRDGQGRTVETPDELFRRVARAVAAADRQHEGEAAGERMEQAYVEAMRALEFLPNSPTLMNAGTSLGQLAACFVLPVGDSLEEIFGAVRAAAIIHQSGGGTGFAFSRLRMKGDRVRETGGVASGPVSFMRVFDVATEVIRQGGRRRGANMGVLDVSHADVLEFIHAKDDGQALRNFNLSVGVSDAFLLALDRGGD